MSWQILATGDCHHAVSEPLPELKTLTQEATGKSIRRVGRFIQMALIGASRCVPGKLPADTAVYLTSGRGDLDLTLEIMTQLFRQAQTPKPLAFVNTVSNAACFYLAQHFGLQTRSNFVCSRRFAFESALELAALDLTLGHTSSALVGSVDIATSPLAEHRQRTGLPPDLGVGEGSHWLWLGQSDATRPRVGDLLAVEQFTDRASLLAWIVAQRLDAQQCQLAGGQFLRGEDLDFISATSGLRHAFAYRDGRGYYDSHSGAVIGEFLRRETKFAQLLHVNADDAGRYSALWVKRP
jgi:hypothetical protein